MSDNQRNKGFIKTTIILFIDTIRGILTLLYRLLFESHLIQFIINSIKYLIKLIRDIINEIFTKHFDDRTYFEIIGSLFNKGEYDKMYSQSKTELKEHLFPKTSALTFPVQKFEDEPDSVTKPIYITLIIRTLMMLIFIIVSLIIFSIIVKIIIASIELSKKSR